MKSTAPGPFLMAGLLAASAWLATVPAAAADIAVNLTAQRMSATLPDGKAVRMWGYCSTPANGDCQGSWAPGPTIVAAAGDKLTIQLKNSLPTPTSLVILGQSGGSVGQPVMVPSPAHPTQPVTWPVPGGAGDPVFTPPAQPPRARAFSQEAGAGSTHTYVWDRLKPGTYLYETGSHPSLQAPMGLYGVLVVTSSPDMQADPIRPGQAYPGAYPGNGLMANVPYDADAVFLFSEIDPVQNAAVDRAATAGADEYRLSTDAGCSNAAPCYPPAISYNPTYFLINGKPFDKTDPAPLVPPVPAAASTGNLLLRFANAGSRTHIPSVVGLQMALIAEDGNVAPGNPKLQSEVLLTAGKTFDVLAAPPRNATAFSPATFALFDRELSLSTDNRPDGGMQGFIQVAGGAAPSSVTPHAVADSYAVPPNSSVYAANVLSNDVAIVNPQLGTLPVNGTVVLNGDGTFTYTPNGGSIVSDSFTYFGNGKPSLSATVTLAVDGSKLGGAPVAQDDSYRSSTGFASGLTVGGRGVLGNDADPSGYAMKAELVPGSASAGLTVTLNADGSFVARSQASGEYSFRYRAINAQGTASAPATVTLAFGQAAGIRISVVDAKTKVALTGQDYRWTIEEDRTFHNQTVPTTGGGAAGIPDILGTNFHASHMPLVATGCTGPISCGDNQTVNGAAVAPAARTAPADVVLDPSKYYYLSVLPADAADADPAVPDSGHSMGGVSITPADIAPAAGSSTSPLQVLVPPTPMKPAQLSIFVFDDSAPTNGAADGTEESLGLGGFAVTLMDTAGRIGDVAGQMTYDVYNMPLTNALFELDPAGCPRPRGAPVGGSGVENRIGVIYTCPEYDEANDPGHLNRLPLAGHALVQNVNPSRYDVMVVPGADRAQKGETWLQVSTLEGTRANDAFAKSGEPPYFQEFGPPGFHAFVGFVNPDKVNRQIDPSTSARNGGLCAPSTGNPNPCPNTLNGRVTNLHMSRPSQTDLFDSNSNEVLAGSTCYVGLNSQNGTGPNIAVAQCDPDGYFKFSGIPDGTYQAVVWDEYLDQIIQYKTVTVPATPGVATTDMGNVPVLSWFTNIEQIAFTDLNHDGIKQDNEPGIAQIPMTVRYRDGSIGNVSVTDSSGNGSINELFPLFNWYVAESDTTRYKGTSVTTVVDGGGPVDPSGPYKGLLTTTYPHGPGDPAQSTLGTYPGDTLSLGIQGFISQTNIINWGKVPYEPGENGGITGMVVYTSTRGFDEPRLEVQFNWEPAVPRVKVRLYRKTVAPDGTPGLVFVKETTTSSWDDNLPTGCPGQRSDDPFVTYTLGTANKDKCYDGFHNWNQTRPAVYDGRYRFNGIPAGKYVVEVIPRRL